MNSEIIRAQYQAQAYTVIKCFKSKKNRVRLLQMIEVEKTALIIEKVFSCYDQMQKELEIFNMMAALEIATPICYGQIDNVLLYQYIEGQTLCEKLEAAEKVAQQTDNNKEKPDNEIVELISKTIDWLNQFHEKTGYCLFDINLRNFIVQKNKIWAIDYEDARKLDKAVDFGRLLAFILTYDPSFTRWKISLVEKIETYIKNNIDVVFSRVMQEKEKELLSIEKRREKLVGKAI
ncbi:MAG: hypothetical protein PHO29_07405 [Acetobacterium sp.]|nr:hypothetical protein [Acetobacterium sp.]